MVIGFCECGCGEGFHVHHDCEVPQCVNPGHLRALSQSAHAALHAELRAA